MKTRTRSLFSYEDLAEVQRKAHLVFWYDLQVNNGGHLQYFENQPLRSKAKPYQVKQVRCRILFSC